ncbi:MAG: hypothetical protein NC211_06890 [Alistipes senegalensis]|nr:hypothetical protein [Oxalobacter formigenes]MCM1281536.1 hypothetical protein [Alistipes senegalensis]
MPFSHMTLYLGKGCPGCALLESYLAAASGRFANLVCKEIYADRAHYEELRETGKRYGIPETCIGIPFLAAGDEYASGHTAIIALLESRLQA